MKIFIFLYGLSDAESKEKHGDWDPMPELTITSPYVTSTQSTPTHLPQATLCQCRLYPPVRDLRFGL
jgi:hypothetical protein